MSVSLSVNVDGGAVWRPAQPVSQLECNQGWLDRVLALPCLSSAGRRTARALARRGFGETKMLTLLFATRMLTIDVNAGLNELEAAGAIAMRPSIRISGYRWINRRD